MYDENSSVLSRTRGAALAAVIMLHVLAGYAIHSGIRCESGRRREARQ
jgi:hypothetical protein